MSLWFLLAAVSAFIAFGAIYLGMFLVFINLYENRMCRVRTQKETETKEEEARTRKGRLVDDFVSRFRRSSPSPAEPTIHPGGEPLPTPREMADKKITDELMSTLEDQDGRV